MNVIRVVAAHFSEVRTTQYTPVCKYIHTHPQVSRDGRQLVLAGHVSFVTAPPPRSPQTIRLTPVLRTFPASTLALHWPPGRRLGVTMASRLSGHGATRPPKVCQRRGGPHPQGTAGTPTLRPEISHRTPTVSPNC